MKNTLRPHLFILVTLIIFCSSKGLSIYPSHNGDPAPGRSPGPPPEDLRDIKPSEVLQDVSPPEDLQDINSSEVLQRRNPPEEMDDVGSPDVLQEIRVDSSSKPKEFSDVKRKDDSDDGYTNSMEKNVLCEVGGSVVEEDSDRMVNVTVSHHLFKVDEVVPGVIYNVIISRQRPGPPIDFSIRSSIEESDIGEFFSEGKRGCRPNIFKSQLVDSMQYALNWTFREDGRTYARTNVTFRLNYASIGDPYVYKLIYTLPILQDCQLFLLPEEAVISDTDLPPAPHECRVWFPRREGGRGLVVQLLRLNVPCAKGYVHLSGWNGTQRNGAHPKSHKQTHLCGKLEEHPEADRSAFFPSPAPRAAPPLMRLQGRPVFAAAYRLVDHCYNVTFTQRNGSFALRPQRSLSCTFRIYLPYGNRVALSLRVGDAMANNGGDMLETPINLQSSVNGDHSCQGLLTKLQDGSSSWSHCTKPGDAEKHIEIVSRENKIELQVIVRSALSSPISALSMRMSYRAEPIEHIVGVCEFGWAVLRQFCVTAVEGVRLPWQQAETECVRRGGHLASIRSEYDQRVLDNLLINSPGYRDDNAYWIGASDKTHEGDFRWSDGLPFSYANWFPGWSHHGHYNRQPNDDGLSEQDCVEVRRAYGLPAAAAGPARLATATFAWNDRDCSTPNYFVCERLQTDEPLEDSWLPECNRTVILSRNQPKASVTSPGFPRQYPDNANCDIDIIASAGYKIILDFEELVLEDEPSCSYDYLMILEVRSNDSSSFNESVASKRLCGDWSSKLKLLRHVSSGSRLRLRFSSDYSHHFGGFKARVSMENVMQCSDDQFFLYNNSCYLIVSYPEVTWNTSQQICESTKANLASVLSAEEERFIITTIRRTTDYRTSALYWLGGHSTSDRQDFLWSDNSPVTYLGWPAGSVSKSRNQEDWCLGVRWAASPAPHLPSGLYWTVRPCYETGGYVCKKPHHASGLTTNHNRTMNGTEGRIATPNYPGRYYHNLDFWVKISGPERSRIIIKFREIDIESQLECLYDYVELKTVHRGSGKRPDDSVKLCGSHDRDMDRFNFVSETNELMVRFHSDYSISGKGFLLTWQAVDVSACPVQTLTAKEGAIVTPNYPNFLLAHLDCTINILAPTGKRIWLEFAKNEGAYEVITSEKDYLMELMLGKRSRMIRPFSTEGLLTEGSFVSVDERVKLHLQTGDQPVGQGFSASYKILGVVEEEKVITLSNSSSGTLLHLNFPDRPPSNVNFIQRFVAPLGYIISLELHNVHFTEADCLGKNGVIEVFDNYSDVNGTTWKLCHDPGGEDVTSVPIYISSFLNTLHVRQRHGLLGVPLNGTMKVQLDSNHLQKLISFKDSEVESCAPSPCQNGGKCISKKSRKFCQCTGHFTGLFCALTKCDLEPCAFGTCSLTPTSYECHCRSGYTGPTCDQKRKPCESNPCDGRGICTERGEGFMCRCHAWWEGPRCERRMTRIPYTPLSERMLHEPFWLGLMTVFVVMGVIGLVWCAKRHFPEKIEKLLAEEDSRNRSTISSLRSSSMRDQLVHASSANPLTSNSASNPAPSPSGGGASSAGGSGSAPNGSAHTAPRSIFGRLGIRKPSILSLTSPHACDRHATARTFSLDDLLKPPPRRTPSPKKKRNNSTPTKKNAAEKKQILQHLVSPINKHNRKVSLGELIQLSEIKSNEPSKKSQDNGKEIESKFGGINPATAALNDPKLEKKVTFARLLNKVSAEMSSGSDFELGLLQSNRLGCAIARPSSTPPSPSADMRSPHSTSSNQGSTSLTSSDLAIPSALSSSISDLLIHRRHNSHHHRLPNGRQKPASADSILAMFRNFSSSTAGVNLPSSLRISPSTTPTASSPQDDLVGDDDSSTSSIHTPISICSLPPESPVSSRQGSQSIEIPVLDPLAAHKSNQASGSNLLHPPTILLEIPSTINKCLSPIHEMPTPLPSPALTPIMRRSPVMTDAATPPGDDAELSDDKISVEIPNVSVVFSDGEEVGCRADIPIDPQAEDGLIMEEAAAMQMSTCKAKPMRPSPVGQATSPFLFAPMITIEPPPLVIPTLTLQTPSPTIPQLPTITFGSPPPVRRTENTCFPFPSPKPSRRMLKDFDKPTSLDLPSAPPMITITCNMSEVESDGDSISPAVNVVATTVGMTYLSPFSMSTRGEHNASESNLSSSGYSSMASPGPSRCGSSNPLCPSEMEDQGPHGSGHGGGHRRQSTPILKTNTSSMACSSNEKPQQQDQRRGRSDSETLSDDPLLESNDEGIGTDHIDDKIDDGEVKSAKELEVFMNETETCKLLLDLPLPPMLAAPKCSLEDAADRLLPPPTANKNSLLLPSIVVQCDSPGCEKHLSPMSSRSESPLSDKTSGMGRFSPQFYGRNKDLLPFTDSDGLYDFPSSDKVNLTTCSHPKKQSRKREKKQLRSIKTPSPTKHQLVHHSLSSHLDIPCKDVAHKVPPPRKLSPKRRIARSQVVSSSSSSDSITSMRENRLSSSSPSPDTIRWSSPVAWSAEKCSRSLEVSAEETNDVQESPSLPNTLDFSKIHYSHQKVSRLRAISHQIRFLRRLEQSLKKKEHVASPDSPDSGEESPRATSPLLQKPRPQPEIRKSSSSGLLQMGGVSIGGRRNGSKKGVERTGQHEPLLAQPVMLAENGYSD